MKNPFKKRISSNSYSSLQSSISFLPPGVNARYQLEIASNQEKIVPLAQDLERTLLTPLLTHPILSNIKGGAANDALLDVVGTVIFGEEDEEEPRPFRYSVATKFHDFAEKDQIRFSWREMVEPDLLQDFKRYELLARPDLVVNQLSLSIELFKSTIVTRLSGFGPVAAEALLLEVSNQILRLSIRSDGLEDIQKLPFGDRPLFDTLDKILAVRYDYSILADYKKHQESLR